MRAVYADFEAILRLFWHCVKAQIEAKSGSRSSASMVSRMLRERAERGQGNGMVWSGAMRYSVSRGFGPVDSKVFIDVCLVLLQAS